MSKIKRKFYKKVSPLIGNFLDSLFLTDFSRRGLDYYHNYHENDYSFNKDEVCLIHVPRTGGGTLRFYLEKNKKFFTLNKGAQHYPISLICNPKEYKYVSIFRNPIDRVISHYNMLLETKTKVASFGFSNWLKNDRFSKNLYCQYFSGHVYEEVNEQIYNSALDNIKNFFFIINFEKFENEIKELLKKLDLDHNIEIKKIGSRIQKNFNDDISKMKILAKEYNSWDLKLFKEFINLKKY